MEWSVRTERNETNAADNLHYNLLTYNVNVEPDEQTHKNTKGDPTGGPSSGCELLINISYSIPLLLRNVRFLETV